MKKNPNLTSQNRLRGHDYTGAGYYFITFCTLDRKPCLGTIEDERLIPFPIGRKTRDEINRIPLELPNVEIEGSAIMPDHVHLLIYVSIESEDISVSDIVRMIKGRTSAAYRQLEPNFGGRLWQKGYSDTVVRNDRHLDEVRRYIAENALKFGKEGWW
ncbi:MAG: transposase [Thermomicrobiales bacterium]|nr:transposase [Thermomicrobiales bacterium]